jgi:hypothetical protein
MQKKMSKKEFKSKCRIEHYSGTGRPYRIIFYDWKTCDLDKWRANETPYWNGYKYAVMESKDRQPLKELIDIAYNWVFNDVPPPWYCGFKLAATDEQRFKVPLSYKF